MRQAALVRYTVILKRHLEPFVLKVRVKFSIYELIKDYSIRVDVMSVPQL